MSSPRSSRLACTRETLRLVVEHHRSHGGVPANQHRKALLGPARTRFRAISSVSQRKGGGPGSRGRNGCAARGQRQGRSWCRPGTGQRCESTLSTLTAPRASLRRTRMRRRSLSSRWSSPSPSSRRSPPAAAALSSARVRRVDRTRSPSPLDRRLGREKWEWIGTIREAAAFRSCRQTNRSRRRRIDRADRAAHPIRPMAARRLPPSPNARMPALEIADPLARVAAAPEARLCASRSLAADAARDDAAHRSKQSSTVSLRDPPRRARAPADGHQASWGRTAPSSNACSARGRCPRRSWPSPSSRAQETRRA